MVQSQINFIAFIGRIRNLLMEAIEISNRSVDKNTSQEIEQAYRALGGIETPKNNN